MDALILWFFCPAGILAGHKDKRTRSEKGVEMDFYIKMRVTPDSFIRFKHS
jgi:hypothetical protein